MTLSVSSLEKIQKEVAKYPSDQKQSAVMSALIIAQDEKGWLSSETMDDVARVLDMPPVAVYEVATFYSMIHAEPIGKYHIQICRTLSCKIRGAGKITEHCVQKLGIKPGETTADGRFTLSEVECLGSCGTAPMLQINFDYHEDLTPEKVDQVLDALP